MRWLKISTRNHLSRKKSSWPQEVSLRLGSTGIPQRKHWLDKYRFSRGSIKGLLIYSIRKLKLLSRIGTIKRIHFLVLKLQTEQKNSKEGIISLLQGVKQAIKSQMMTLKITCLMVNKNSLRLYSNSWVKTLWDANETRNSLKLLWTSISHLIWCQEIRLKFCVKSS